MTCRKAKQHEDPWMRAVCSILVDKPPYQAIGIQSAVSMRQSIALTCCVLVEGESCWRPGRTIRARGCAVCRAIRLSHERLELLIDVHSARPRPTPGSAPPVGPRCHKPPPARPRDLHLDQFRTLSDLPGMCLDIADFSGAKPTLMPSRG